MGLVQSAKLATISVVSGVLLLGLVLVVSAESGIDGQLEIAPHLPGYQYAEIAETDENSDPSPGKLLPDDDYQIPEIQRDVSKLAYPARQMHQLLVDAAKSGDIAQLTEYIGSGEDMTMLSPGGMDGNPIEFLKSMSGDDEGYEILAILEEVLEAGFVHLDKGTENEIYVWPYFYGIPIHDLDARQRVELYKLMTHGDFEEMKTFGAYSFYRVGITPEGRWRFFVAGD